MSTSARIIIRTATALWAFDKWHDGYPDHTMPVLQAFLEDVQKNGPPADATEAASRLNQADYPNHWHDGYPPDSRDDIEISSVYKTDGPANPISLRDPDRMAWDRYDRNYYYLVDLASQTPTAQESPETPQAAAARFWKWIKDGQGETDGAEIETWLQENTPEGDHRRETRIAIAAGAEPMNLPTLTPRLTEQDLRDILGDTQKDLLAAWKRAETAEEMLDESEINPETGNPWKEDYEEKVDELEEAEEAKVNPDTGNTWEEDYETEKEKREEAEADQVNPDSGRRWEDDYYDEKEERERLEEELEKAEEKEQEAREAQAAAEAERDQARAELETTIGHLNDANRLTTELTRERDQARQDHERTLDRLTRAEIRAADLEKEIWEAKERTGQAEKRHATTKSFLAEDLRDARTSQHEAEEAMDAIAKELEAERKAHQNAIQSGSDLLRKAQAERDQARQALTTTIEDRNLVAKQRNQAWEEAKDAKKKIEAGQKAIEILERARQDILLLMMPAVKQGWISEADILNYYDESEITIAKLRTGAELTDQERQSLADLVKTAINKPTN